MSAAARSERSRALRNVLSNWGTFLVNALVAFFLSPYIVRTLGGEVYGAWVLIGSLVGYLGLLDVGVRGAVTKFVATHHAAGDHAEASRVTAAALTFFGASGLVAVALSVVLASALLPHFGIPDALRADAEAALVLSGLTLAITLVTNVFGGVVIGVQRFDRMNAVYVAGALVRAAATVAVLEAGGGFVGLAWVQLAATALQGGATWWLSRALYPELRPRRAGWTRRHLAALFAFGITSVLIQASGMVVDYSNSAVIGALLSVGAITPFAIAANLVLYARGLVSGISHVVTPMAGALEGRRELDRMRVVLVDGARFATMVIAPIAAVFMVRGTSFVSLWMGPEYGPDGGHVLWILSVALLSFASFQILVNGLMGLNRHRILVPFFVAEAAANVALAVALAPALGVIGVAWGTTLPRVANALVAAPLLARRVLGVRPARYLLHGVARPALAVLPFALACELVERRWPAASMLGFFAQVGATLPIAGAGLWALALDGAERRSAAASLLGALGRARLASRAGAEKPGPE